MIEVFTNNWQRTAVETLQQGQTVQIRPCGNSMQGIIEDGELISVQPCCAEDLHVGDAVLARVKGKRFVHIVVHLVQRIDNGRFLIGSNNGRLDGWVQSEDISGKVTQILSIHDQA